MRRSGTLLLLLLVAIPLLVNNYVSAAGSLKLDEARTRIQLNDGRITASLAFNNSLNRNLESNVSIALIDPSDDVDVSTELFATIAPGESKLSIPIPLNLDLAKQSDRQELLWYRLKYVISPSSGATKGFAKTEGIISLSEITPDIFDLQVAGPSAVRPGMPCRIHISTLHPISSRPVSGVSVEAKITFWLNKEETSVSSTGLTDDEGLATMDLNLPRNIDPDDGDVNVEVIARRGEFVQEADDEIDLDINSRILLTTDKPLYQPGQTLHMRALVFDSAKRAKANEETSFVVEDPEGSIVYRNSVNTSRFGISSTDWTIPDNMRLGDYSIRAEAESVEQDSESSQIVKISRYDLPNFTVQANPNKPYYLPGVHAEVEISGAYLFGQPVKRGHVKVIRESARRWNYKEQKWMAEESETYEGETDQDGRFVAHIDLQKFHDELAARTYERFDDLTFAAYFTDQSTGRTEQRRFDLRVTQDAIHIYVNDALNGQAMNLPLEFYIATYYADGAPVECNVVITDNNAGVTGSNKSLDGGPAEILRTVRTNRFGVAKVSDLVLTARNANVSEASLGFKADDSKGAAGIQSNTFWLSDKPLLRVKTDKVIYRPGEAIKGKLISSDPNMRVAVNVLQRGVNLFSDILQLKDGQANFVTPANLGLTDKVNIVAYPLSTGNYGLYNLPVGLRSVLFPHERDLSLSVRFDQDAYRPGQDAVADFSIKSPDGTAAESALGIVIYDQAVEERARTGRDFSGGYGFYSSYKALTDDKQMSGISLRDLKRLDLSKPIPSDIELVAEMLLREYYYRPTVFGSESYSMDQKRIFEESIETRTSPLKSALTYQYERFRKYPTNEASLRLMLKERGVNWDTMRDPWLSTYLAEFSIDRDQDVLIIKSAGADKRFGTSDDFTATKLSWPYFARTGEIFTRAVEQFHARTGRYVRADSTINAELARNGLKLSRLRDRWGHQYKLQYGINGFYYALTVKSGGPNGKFEDQQNEASDDFTVWNVYTDYFVESRAKIETALARYLKATSRFPQNDGQLREALLGSKLGVNELHDPWEQDLFFSFSREWWVSDKTWDNTRVVYGVSSIDQSKTSQIMQNFNFLRVLSSGADGQRGTADDFALAGFTRSQVEDAAQNQRLFVGANPAVRGSKGAVSGTIRDPNGAVVAGANVKAIRMIVPQKMDANSEALAALSRETHSNDEGEFLLGNLPVGFYRIEFNAPGFAVYVVEMVPVRSSTVTRVDGTLMVAGTSMSVTVTGDVPSFETQSLTTQSFGAEYGKSTGGIFSVAQNSTPRLREYFPETLVWQPSLETDANGNARLSFKLADNITTWNMSVISSTVNGDIGVTEKQIRAFQPFFVEHDPPRVLTEGDQIQLPVVLRNYLSKSQTVNLELKPESWFTMIGPAQQELSVESGDATRAIFNFRASSSVKDGKQRISAISTEANDAIEKPITVHPDGQEISTTRNSLLAQSVTIDANFPSDTIKGSGVLELKIYTNLMAHVIDSIEGIVQRPHGCGEQTISSTYPSLLALKAYKRSETGSPIQKTAKRYLQEGYERLLNYRASEGGFNYWGTGEADLALTAYALRFLNDADEFIEVDEELKRSTVEWLIKQQRADGSWAADDHRLSSEDNARSEILTAYIARALITSAPDYAMATLGAKKELQRAPLTRALDYLQTRVVNSNEPYLLSAYVLTSLEAKDRARASKVIERLTSLAKSEDEMAYWAPVTSTPFHGWGLAGQIETTSLAVQALTRFYEVKDGKRIGPTGQTNADLISRGLLYLLKNKDRYGVWYSTQATVNVLDTLVLSLSADSSSEGSKSKTDANEDEAEIIVNGRRALTIKLPSTSKLTGPLNLDLSEYISAGNNNVTIRRGAGQAAAAVLLVQKYYLPWNSPSLSSSVSAASRALRLAVEYDRGELKVGEEATCKVEAQRVGKSGYGMLLAEIGLPPGADVDRASLESAVKNSGWSLSQYDVLPDRLVVYLWPQSGGTRFEFKFKMRYGVVAQTAPSSMYDYYNPDARVVVAPTKFMVR